MRQLRFAFRALFQTPFVTIVAIVSLALGIGANSAVFSLFDQLLMRALPVPAPHELVNLGAPGPKPGSQSCGQAGDCDVVFSYAMFRDLEREQDVFTGLAAHRRFGASLSYGAQTETGDGLLVSGGYFPALGVQPALGRLIGPGDDRVIGDGRVVVLSHDYWRTRFGENANVLNTTMTINGETMTIVGVAARGFWGTTLGEQPKVFVPVTMRAQMEPPFKDFDNRRSYWAYVFGRLKPGVSIDDARARLNVRYQAIVNNVEAALQTGMSEQTMARFRAKPLTMEPGSRGQSSLHGEASAPLTMLFALTAVVLLIACANIANLLLARSAARSGEMAVRLSIGAGRGQLIRQLLLEACLLAGLGGAAGLLVARWTLLFIGSLLPPDASSIINFRVDASLMLFAAALSLGTGVLFGLFPAVHSTRPDLASTLKGVLGQPAGARSAAWFRKSLVTAQITLSMGLLVLAGLFLKSLVNVTRVDLGLKVDHLVSFTLAPGVSGYTPERSRDLFRRVEETLAATPGVTGVTASVVRLLSGSNWGTSLTVQGFPAGPDTDTHSFYNEIGPGYFRTLGIPLLAGREFTWSDVAGAPKVAIVNEAFLKKFNLGRDAVGTRMRRGRGQGPLDIEIVGIVQNAKYSEVKAAIPPVFFIPYQQDEQIGAVHFYVRTAGEPDDFIQTVPRMIATFDSRLPVANPMTVVDQARQNVFLDRFISTLSASFAGLATLLAAIGLYGVLAYTVAQRTREFGLRMALGAGPGRVRRLVLTQVGWMTLVGGVLGTTAAIYVGRLGRSLLYELQSHDPFVLGGSVVLLALVALAAGLIPAMRASRIDPMRALRE